MAMLNPPWNELVSSLVNVREYSTWFPGRMRYLRDFTAWRSQAMSGPPVSAEGPQRLTVVLLSYRRIHNMEPLVRNLLRADFVGRVIVSNNNPGYRIAEWIRLSDERLQLVDQPGRRPAGIRFELIRDLRDGYFASIDDDVFLSPEQLRRLFAELLANPSIPHGFKGETHDGGQGRASWSLGLRGERRVDGLSGLYLFTREHLEELYRLAGLLDLDVGNLANGEDLLLSFSGSARPAIHDIGTVAECLSSHRVGVATWRTHQHFFRERGALLQRLRELKPLPRA